MFTPTTDAGQYLRDYYGAPEPQDQEPLTGEAVARALKRYASSDDVPENQLFLDHKRLDTTSIYLEQPTGQERKHWRAIANTLGV